MSTPDHRGESTGEPTEEPPVPAVSPDADPAEPVAAEPGRPADHRPFLDDPDRAEPRPDDRRGGGPHGGDTDDMDARFLAIVSGIAPSMRWLDQDDEPPTRAGTDDLRPEPPSRLARPARPDTDPTGPDGPDDRANGQIVRPPAGRPPGPIGPVGGPPGPVGPVGGPGSSPDPDTADDRTRRREARRRERAEEVAAFYAEQAEREREHAEDDAHFVPPPPPPLPRLRGRTVAALLAIVAGVLLLARPTLLALNQDVSIVLAVVIILAGLGVLVAGLHRPPPDGWDDGARL